MLHILKPTFSVESDTTKIKNVQLNHIDPNLHKTMALQEMNHIDPNLHKKMALQNNPNLDSRLNNAAAESTQKTASAQPIAQQKEPKADRPLQAFLRESDFADALKYDGLWDASEAELDAWLRKNPYTARIRSLKCTSVPPQIEYFENLKYLYVDASKQKGGPLLPAEIRKLPIMSLSIVAPDATFTLQEIKDLKYLRDLHLFKGGGNSSLKLEKGDIPYNLETLSIKGVKCDVFPYAKLPNLKRLAMTDCGLKVFEVGYFETLQLLDLSGNEQFEIKGDITKLKSLEALGLRDCKLKIEDYGIGKLKHLRYLDVIGNDLDKAVLYKSKYASGINYNLGVFD